MVAWECKGQHLLRYINTLLHLCISCTDQLSHLTWNLYPTTMVRVPTTQITERSSTGTSWPPRDKVWVHVTVYEMLQRMLHKRFATHHYPLQHKKKHSQRVTRQKLYMVGRCFISSSSPLLLASISNFDNAQLHHACTHARTHARTQVHQSIYL